MSKVAILLDSSFTIKNGDFPDVFVVPIVITETNKDGTTKTYFDGETITDDELCQKLISGSNIQTSQPVFGSVIKKLEEITPKYDTVFCFCLPSTISGTYNTWKTLEQEFSNVKVYNQTMLGILSRWTMLDFIEQKKQNKLTDEFIVNYLKKVEDSRAGLLIVPDPTQLKKGGRVNGFQSLLIKLLKFKLLISFDKKGLIFKDKCIKIDETINKGSEIINQSINFKNRKIKRFVIFHSKNTTDSKFNIDEYISIIKNKFPNYNYELGQFPSSIVAHVGAYYIAFGMDLE